MRNVTVDVTGGPLTRSILTYSFPVMLASLIQVLFNAADIMVLGNMASQEAVAAVGVTGPIVSLVVTSFVGLSGGTNVLLARYLGAVDRHHSHACVDTSLLMAFFIGMVIAVGGWFLSPALLRSIDCPPNCLADATLYLRLYFLGAPAIMLYNFAATVIRVSGNSTQPLFYMIYSGLLNVGMNILLCFLMAEKVAAVAIATLISQMLGAALTLRHLWHVEGLCQVRLREMTFSFPELGGILGIGLPCALNSAMFSISNLQIQSAINAYGEAAIAGNTATGSVEGLAYAFANAFGVAALAFVGQNIGAGNRERVRATVRQCLLFGFLVGGVLGLGLFLCGRGILSLYLPGEESAIAYGYVRMRYVLAFYFIAGTRVVLDSVLQAFGHSLLSALNGIVTVFLFRIFWMTEVYPLYMTIDNLYLCYTVSWILGILVAAVSTAIVFCRYMRGRGRLARQRPAEQTTPEKTTVSTCAE